MQAVRKFIPHCTVVLLWVISNVLLPVNVVAQPPGGAAKAFQLKLLDEYVIPYNLRFNGTTVGGLSGIDYDAKEHLYYSISDDRSAINPARFYTYHIRIKDDKIDTVIFNKVTFLKAANGKVFAPTNANAATVDPEALRVWNGNIIWSSEGDRIVRNGKFILRNPQIFKAGMNGEYMDTFPLPKQMRVTSGNSGVRQNGGFEGVAISPDRKFFFVSVEEPLLQDGPRAGTGDSTGIVRILKYDIKTGKPMAQFAYMIDPVAYPVHPPSGFRVNGISDIMCLDSERLLVVERSFSTGRLTCTIKVFIADLSTASDISSLKSLKDKSYHVAKKRLVLNMDSLGIFVDNIEGVTFGPRLANGDASLIFIADNNFNFFEKSQLLLMRVLH